MNVYRKLEIVAGITTLIMSMAATVLVEVPKVTPGFIQEQFLGIVVYLLPAMLVAFGAFLDAVKHSVLGLVVLWIGGLLLTLWLLVGVFGGVLYVYGLVGGLAMLAPAIPAIASMIASIQARWSAKNKQEAR